MGLLKKLAGETVLYGVSSIVPRLLNFLLVFLYTHKVYGFQPADYGAMTLFYAYIAFLNIIFTYGMETAFFRYTSQTDKPKEIYNLILSYIFLTTIVFSGILIVFSQSIATWLGYPDKASFVIWIAVILAVDTLLAIPYARLRFEKKARQFALTKLFNIILTIFLNVFFLVICRELYASEHLRGSIAWFYLPTLGIGYVFLANLLANLLNALLLYRCFIDFRFRFDWAAFRPLLIYAIPLAVMGLAGMVNQMVDKIMLKALLPADFYAGQSADYALGVYGACFKLSVFMNLAIQAFKYAAEPFFFSQAQDKNSPAVFAQVMRYFIIVCVVLWLGVCLNLGWIKWLFIRNEAYHAGVVVVPILLLANMLLGIYYNLSFWFKLTDKTHYGLWISGVGAMLTIGLNFALIPYFGYVACAWVALLSYTLMAWLCYAWGQYYYPIPYHLSSAFGHIGVASVLVIVSLFFPIENIGLSLLFNAGLFGVYVVFLGWMEKKAFILLFIRK
jgi:O-antigen/teichoic acid export membrane protein